MPIDDQQVWPIGTDRDASGVLRIGGVRLPDLVAEYGSPLYVYDERTIRESIRSWKSAIEHALPVGDVVYAGKAFLAKALIEILVDEGCGLDVVSGGELGFALACGMPANRITLHGNNKQPDELRMAVDAGIGTIIVDNLDDVEILSGIVPAGKSVDVALRVNPGVDVHTHRKISTGVADSKFGLPIADGQAEACIARIMSAGGLRLVGYHAHIGSQLFDTDASGEAIRDIVRFAADMQERHGAAFEWMSPGGGFGIGYMPGDAPPSADAWVDVLAKSLICSCAEQNLRLPAVTLEPGRSVIGRSGVAVYTVGSRKVLPGIRTYVSVDGGMADNIRPTLYEARYHAAVANRDGEGDSTERATIAGKYCESGDILIDGITLPQLRRGDLLALPAAGAYCLAMASNYNMSFRPAIAMVRDGNARLIRRRETLDDLLQLDA